MSPAARLTLTESQQQLLEKWSRGGSTPYRVVIRSKIVLLAAQRRSNRSIARELHTNPVTVARWRSRFLLFGVDGIRYEAPRLGSPPRVSEELVQTILHKTLFERPRRATRWSTRSLARAVGVSHSTVRRVWKAHDVSTSRSRVATLARDSRFLPKSVDLVGVYVNPPQRAVAISLSDHGSSHPARPAAEPSAPGSRPISVGKSWMTDLVTTLNLLDKNNLKGSSRRLVDREFLSFLHSVEQRRRSREQIHLLAESAPPTTPPSLARWLKRYPEFSADVRAANGSLRQIVVEWFRDGSSHRIAETPPASLPGLRAAIERWVGERSDAPRPFAWTRE